MPITFCCKVALPAESVLSLYCQEADINIRTA